MSDDGGALGKELLGNKAKSGVGFYQSIILKIKAERWGNEISL